MYSKVLKTLLFGGALVLTRWMMRHVFKSTSGPGSVLLTYSVLGFLVALLGFEGGEALSGFEESVLDLELSSGGDLMLGDEVAMVSSSGGAGGEIEPTPPSDKPPSFREVMEGMYGPDRSNWRDEKGKPMTFYKPPRPFVERCVRGLKSGLTKIGTALVKGIGKLFSI